MLAYHDSVRFALAALVLASLAAGQQPGPAPREMRPDRASYAPPTQVVAKLGDPQESVRGAILHWTNDGRKLIVAWLRGGRDRLTFWDVSRQTQVVQWESPHRVNALWTDDDGSEVRAFFLFGYIGYWDAIEAGSEPHLNTSVGPTFASDISAQFLPDGRLAIQQHHSNTCNLFVYSRAGKIEQRASTTWPMSTRMERASSSDFRGQGTVVHGPGGWRFDLAKGRALPRLQGSPTCRIIYMLNTECPACAAGRTVDGSALEGHVWESTTGGIIAELPKTLPNSEKARMSPDGRFLAVAADDLVAVYDLSNNLSLRQMTVANPLALAFSPDGLRLAIARSNGTIQIWSVPESSSPWKAERVDRLWDDLQSDAATAWKCLWHLCQHPAPVTKMLSERLKPATPFTGTARRIASLDGENYAAREKAMKELAARGERIEGDLRAALKVAMSEEQRTRLERLLAKLDPATPPAGETLRTLRCIWLLERLGTPEAKKLLDKLASGAPGARVTIEARAALAQGSAAFQGSVTAARHTSAAAACQSDIGPQDQHGAENRHQPAWPHA